MSLVRPKKRIKGAAKSALKVALLIAFAASLTRTSMAEHFSSRCGGMPRLVPSIRKSTAARFALEVSLRSFSSAKTSLTLPIAKENSELDFFSLNGSSSNGEESWSASSASERAGSLRLKPSTDSSTLPHLLAWLDGWRMDMERGLFRPLRNQASRLAIAYTDIFDTRGNPDKGSHGLGILLRYDFRKASERR